MILRTSDPTEKEIIDWYIANFGTEDATAVIDWVWSRERTTGRFVGALWYIAREVNDKGKVFFFNILRHTKVPKSQREAEEQIMEIARPFVEKARITILGHRGAEDAVEGAMRELRVRLREEIRKMWPDKHRATIDGAILSATVARGGASIIDFKRLVEALSGPDALATTASQSHGVSQDR
jgi:hypothetical protein